MYPLNIIIIISLSLAVDAFAASISCGMSKKRSKEVLALKVALFFGGFQFGMTLLGWALGTGFSSLISNLDHFIAFGLLLIIGARMVYEAVKEWKSKRECRPISNRMLLGLAVATSIDSLAVGITFGFLDLSILLSSIVIGSVTFVLSAIGVLIGNSIKGRFDKYAEVAAGLVLVAIGTKILVEHLS